MLIAEAQYSSNFLRSNRKLCFSLRYNGSNSFLFVNAKKKYQHKAGLIKCVYDFSVDCKAFVISDITNIHKYLMKKPDIKCLG